MKKLVKILFLSTNLIVFNALYSMVMPKKQECPLGLTWICDSKCINEVGGNCPPGGLSVSCGCK
jgi:hypothetical protein